MATKTRANVEPATDYPGRYRVRGFSGVACFVVGWETEPLAEWWCSDCDRSGYERDGGGGGIYDRGDDDCEHEHVHYSVEPSRERTGRLLVCMVGDDRHHSVDPSDLTPLKRSEFCGECGQIGCHCDAYPEGDDAAH